MPRDSHAYAAMLTTRMSSAAVRALVTAMLLGTVLVVLIGGLRGVT